MSTAGTGGGQHDRDRDKDKDIQSVTENYQVGSLASSYCDKEIEENMASSINSQMSSIISDCDEERGRGRGREDGLSAHKRLVRGNKTHQDSFGDSDGGSEGADLFSMIACGEVKDNKALRDLIRKHDAQHSVFSSSKHKSHPSRDLMGVDEKKAKDREKDRERERERIISISANGSLSRTFRGFGGSSNMSIATYLEPPALQLSQRPISAASAGVGYGGIPHGAARGFEENNPYLHNHRYEPRRSPERKVRADSLHEGSSPRPRRRFGSGLSEESDTGSVVSFADVITVHENEREVIPVSMTAFPTEGCYAASIASLRPFVANRSEGVDSIPISDIRGENDRKRSSETLAPSVVANGSIGGSITVVSKRPQKACRNISSSANDRPINPTKYLMTQQYSDPSDLGSAASSSNSLSFNRDVSTLKADVPGSAFISDTSSELILSDMIDIEGDASRGEVLSCGSSVGIGILVGDVSSHGLGSFMTTESICNSSGKAEERGDEMISDGRERSDSGNVLYLKDYLSSACDRELKVEGEEEEQGVMASEVEGDIMVNQRVHRKSAALHIVPDAAGQDKSALSMRDAAPVEECDVKFSAESHSLNVAELLTLGSTFIRKWLGNKSVIDSSGGKGKGRSEGQSTGPLQDCEDSALSACITANARVAGNILTPATSGAVNLMSLGAAGGGGGGAAAASGSSSLVNRVGTNGSKIEIGFEGSDSRRSSIEKTKEYHNSHVGSAPSNHQYSSSPSQFISPSQHPSSSSHYMHHHSSTAIKPPRGHDTSKDNLKTNYVYDKKEAMRQFVMKFRARYEVNPFRKEDGSGFLKTRTHNRRRWSHIFPAGKLEMVGYYGLNWKSLSQPAILPSSTDFLVPLSELKDEDKFEIQGNYSLIMDPTECAFDAPENLLTEMICQRLAQVSRIMLY